MEEKKYSVSKISLYIRILIMAYVLYLAGGVLGNINENEGTAKWLLLLGAIILLIGGIIIIGLAVKALIKKEYN